MTVAALAIVALVIIGVLLVWYSKRESGSIGVDIEMPSIKTSVTAETKKLILRPGGSRRQLSRDA